MTMAMARSLTHLVLVCLLAFGPERLEANNSSTPAAPIVPSPSNTTALPTSPSNTTTLPTATFPSNSTMSLTATTPSDNTTIPTDSPVFLPVSANTTLPADVFPTNDTLGESTISETATSDDCRLCLALLNFTGIITPAVPQNICVGNDFQLSCPAGYELINKDQGLLTLTVRCEENYQGGSKWYVASGNWSLLDMLPERCFPITCDTLDIADSNISQIDRFMYDSPVGVMCNDGYLLNGTATLECSMDGSWPDTLPSCRLATCSQSEYMGANYDLSLTSPVQSEYNYLDMITVVCARGHVLSTDNRVNATFTCGADENWISLNDGVGKCVPLKCDALAVSQLLLVQNDTGNTLEYGMVVNFSCEAGYTLNGSQSSTCLETGEWSHAALPECKKTMCDGNLNQTQIPADVDDFFCHCLDGQRPINGSAHTHRLGNGQWNDSIAVCGWITCRALDELQNGTIFNYTGIAARVNSTVDVACDEGFVLQGSSNKTVCQSSGKWRPQPDWTCTRTCGEPAAIANGSHQGGFNAGDRVLYGCNHGYYITVTKNTSTVIVCGADGVWSADTAPACVYIECGQVNTTDSHLEASRAGSGANSTVHYSCNNTYVPDTSRSTCVGNGTWNPLPEKVKCIEDTSRLRSMLLYIVIPSVLGSTFLLIAIAVLCYKCVMWRRNRSRGSADNELLIGSRTGTGRRSTLTGPVGWLYENKPIRLDMPVVRPGTSSRTHPTGIGVGNALELVDTSHLRQEFDSAVTLTTTLPSDHDSNAEPLQFDEDQLALFSKHHSDPMENALAAELDDLIRTQPSRRMRKRDPQLRGSESDVSSHFPSGTVSSLSRAGSQVSNATTQRNSSLSHRSVTAVSLDSDSDSAIFTTAHRQSKRQSHQQQQQSTEVNPYKLTDITSNDVQSYSGDDEQQPARKQRRQSSIKDLIQRYDAPSKGSPTVLKVLATADEISEAYDTPSALPRQVTQDSPRPGIDATAKRRTISDNLPPLPKDNHPLSKLTQAGSNKDLAASAGSDVALSSDDERVNGGYEDLKTVRGQVHDTQAQGAAAAGEKSLKEMLDDDDDGESNTDSDGTRYERLEQHGGAKQKTVKPYEDLQKIRQQLEEELIDDDIVPYARVPPMFAEMLRSDEDLELASHDDAQPYARVPQILSILSSDDRETINTVHTASSFRGRTLERFSDDEGISTDNTTRAEQSEGSQTELKQQLEVIIDQPQREGERTPPYAKIRVTTKKRSSATIPPPGTVSAFIAARRESFGNDSGLADSEDSRSKNSPSQRRPGQWRKVLKEQSSSDESDAETKHKKQQQQQKRRTVTANVTAPAAASPEKPEVATATVSKEEAIAAAKKERSITLSLTALRPERFDSPVNTPEVPRRTFARRILDHNTKR
eukprot:scpid15063/ scgid1366/ CUB and sushi domain-containing protein 1; CUB and sushi multiple domains protein 1